MKTNKDIGIFLKLLLKIITFFQEATLKQDNNSFYYKLTKLHFELYFGKSLVEEAILSSREFKAAQKRHVSMVMLNVCMVNKGKNNLAKVIGDSFHKNLLLEAVV